MKGGVIPTVFIPAVEKGVRQALDDGVIAGYPVEDLRVIVYDGKSHDVDSQGDRLRHRRTQGGDRRDPQGAPDHAGADRQHRDHRARPLRRRPHRGPLVASAARSPAPNPRGGEPHGDPGQVPLSEVTDYQSRLRSVTGGQGAYTIEFSHYAAGAAADAAAAGVAVQAGARGGLAATCACRGRFDSAGVARFLESGDFGAPRHSGDFRLTYDDPREHFGRRSREAPMIVIRDQQLRLLVLAHLIRELQARSAQQAPTPAGLTEQQIEQLRGT